MQLKQHIKQHLQTTAHPNRDRLERGLGALGFEASAMQIEQLLDYLDLIAKWNRVHNLTAIRDVEQMVAHHLLDSLAVQTHLRKGSLVDIGSGAGLPGVPLAIMTPTLPVTLVESNQKKAAFLLQAIADLSLANVKVVAGRVETLRPASRYAQVISRAFAELALFAQLAEPILAPGGIMLAMKGQLHPDELAAIPDWLRVVDKIPLEIPGLDAARHLVVLARA